MLEIKQEKNKYFIYNEDYKILVFSYLSKHGNMTILLPELSSLDVDNKKEFHKSIRNLLLKEEDICYIGQVITDMPIYESQNNKLKKVLLKKIRNYYSCYKEFSKEDYDYIIKLCNEFDVLPHFLTIQELKQLIDKSDISLQYKDAKMYASLEELERRLSFKKY